MATLEEEEIGDISRKMEQVEHSYSNPKKSYNKLGSAGIKGSLYQIDLLTLVLLNGMQKVKNWRLSTEDKQAAQLDDLIFERLPSESAILLQAKHKEDEKKQVTYKDLMSVNKDSEFSLPKYFFSYQEVKSKFKVQNVVICTNLKVDKKTESILKAESVDPDSVLYFEGAENICYGFSGCSLPELKQNIQTYQDKNLKNKEVTISDEDISDYLNHLIFFPNCLVQKNVENIIHQTISQMKLAENLNSKMIQTYIQKKMMDWFKEKKGRYLTEVEAKAFFCDIRSNKYCEHLKLYDVCFKNNNLPLILQTQQRNGKKGEKSRQQNENDPPAKRISHIIPDKEYMLNVVKIYQALPTDHKDKTLFVNPEETIEVQRQIVGAFEVPHYTILVIVCPDRIKETIAEEMCDKVMKVLKTHKYKHVILIAEEKNNLATQLRNTNINYCEVISDSVTFADLEAATQGEFKRKRLINFQGYTVSLKELFTFSTEEDLNQIVNSEMLIKLARGGKTEVGLELSHPDNYYISRSFMRKSENISEEDMWRYTEVSEEKVILVSDSAGMGKSSVLTSLANSIKRDNPRLWVVSIDLSNYTNIMRTTLEGRKSVSIIEMLNSHETSKLKSDFAKKLFTTPKRIVLMLDGVDEVSPTYTQLVINLIKNSLAQVNLAKIFVTTRPHMSKDFKKIWELQSFTFKPSSKNHQEKIPDLKFFTLEPFSKDNQIDFLTKYWTENLNLQDDVRKSKCNIFAAALIKNISVWINEKDQNNFAGIPLQTRMLAEIFQEKNDISDKEHDWEGCKEFLSSNNEYPKLPTRIDLTQLYKLFIGKKRDIFFKNGNPSGHPLIDDLLKKQFEKCVKFHCRMALEVIFDSGKNLHLFTCYTNDKWPNPSTFEDNFLFRVGIVQSQGGHIEFLHRTFAECFAADCLLIELEQEPVNEEFQQFFMSSILLENEFYVIRAFLDSRMRNAWHLVESNFCNYFHRNRISEKSLSRYFQVCAEEGCARIFQYLIECIDKEQREILSKAVNKPSIMYEALSPAIRCCHLNILKLLLELNETFNKGKDTHKQFLAFVVMYAFKFNLKTFKFLSRKVDGSDENILERTALHEAAFMGRFGKLELWVEKTGADINMKDNIRGWAALYGAISMSRLEAVKFLVIEAGTDVNVQDHNGETIFFAAAAGDELEIAKFLVEEAGADINAKSNNGSTAFHVAASGGKLEIVEYLAEEAGADINVKDNDGGTALLLAAYEGKLEIVKFLVEEAGADINIKDNYGGTALHSAAFGGKLETVKYLVEVVGAHINVKNNDGVTELYAAAFGGRLEIVKYLVEEAGAHINVKNNDGMTELYAAAYGGQLEIVKYLVDEAKADINIKDNDGMTALYAAASRGELEIVKFLVEEAGADINMKNNYDMTPVYVAALGGKLEIVKYLVKEAGADINIKDNYGGTALHSAARRGKLETVKYLVEEAGANINIKDNDGMTALHKAAFGDELETIKYLMGKAGEDLNVTADNAVTPLHIAASRGELEIVKYLMEETANVKSNHIVTALRVAANRGHWEVVKFLSNSSPWVMFKMKTIHFFRGKFP